MAEAQQQQTAAQPSGEVTSKIRRVLNVRKTSSEQWGDTFFFDLEMENDDIGSIGKKKEDALKPGDSLTYTKEVKGRFTNFKEVKKDGFRGGGGRASGPSETLAQTALKCAVTCFVERNKSEATKATPTQLAEGVASMADKFLAWLKQNP